MVEVEIYNAQLGTRKEVYSYSFLTDHLRPGRILWRQADSFVEGDNLTFTIHMPEYVKDGKRIGSGQKMLCAFSSSLLNLDFVGNSVIVEHFKVFLRESAAGYLLNVLGAKTVELLQCLVLYRDEQINWGNLVQYLTLLSGALPMYEPRVSRSYLESDTVSFVLVGREGLLDSSGHPVAFPPLEIFRAFKSDLEEQLRSIASVEGQYISDLWLKQKVLDILAQLALDTP